MNVTLTMVGVPRLVPTLKSLSCAAVEVDSIQLARKGLGCDGMALILGV